MGQRHTFPSDTSQPQQPVPKPAEAVKASLKTVACVAMAVVILVLVVAFAAYGMFRQDGELLAEVWSLVKGGAWVVALWAGGEKIARVVGKLQD